MTILTPEGVLLDLNGAVARLLEGASEVGLSDVVRNLHNRFDWDEHPSWVARAIRYNGWLREGWLYTGYDRTPRYVRRHVA